TARATINVRWHTAQMTVPSPQPERCTCANHGCAATPPRGVAIRTTAVAATPPPGVTRRTAAVARTRGVAAGRSAQRACERSSDWRRGAAGSPDPELVILVTERNGGSSNSAAWRDSPHDGGSTYAGGRRGKERAASLRAEQRLAAGGRRLPRPGRLTVRRLPRPGRVTLPDLTPYRAQAPPTRTPYRKPPKLEACGSLPAGGSVASPLLSP